MSARAFRQRCSTIPSRPRNLVFNAVKSTDNSRCRVRSRTSQAANDTFQIGKTPAAWLPTDPARRPTSWRARRRWTRSTDSPKEMPSGRSCALRTRSTRWNGPARHGRPAVHRPMHWQTDLSTSSIRARQPCRCRTLARCRRSIGETDGPTRLRWSTGSWRATSRLDESSFRLRSSQEPRQSGRRRPSIGFSKQARSLCDCACGRPACLLARDRRPPARCNLLEQASTGRRAEATRNLFLVAGDQSLE